MLETLEELELSPNFDAVLYQTRWGRWTPHNPPMELLTTIDPTQNYAARLRMLDIGNYFDVDPESGKISYSPAGKEQGYESKGRVAIKPGRFLKTLFSRYPDAFVESFTVMWKAEAGKLAEALDFTIEVLDGEDIREAYHYQSYSTTYRDLGDLSHSCMRYAQCQEYFDIYVKNTNVRLLVAKDPEGAIIARTLVWTLNDGTVAIDRIYGGQIVQVHLRNYAKEQGWIDLSREYVNAVVELEQARFASYPYLDSMFYLKLRDDGTGYLSNNNSNGYDHGLTSTGGGPNLLPRYAHCDHCAAEVEEHELRYVRGDVFEHWCSDCRSCGECNGDGADFWDDIYLYEHDGEYYCEDCRDNLHRCNDCQELVGEAALQDGLCEQCYTNVHCNACDGESEDYGATYCRSCAHDPEVWAADEALCNDCGRAVDREGDPQCFMCEMAEREAA